MSEEERRAAIVAEARTWLRTPYIHLAAVKGAGVDCAMLLVEVYRQPLGPVPPDYDPRPYSPDWYLHQSEERYLIGIEAFAHPIELAAARPADVLMYRFGRTVSHGAIVVDDELMIHANLRSGNVELCERRTFAERFDSARSIF
jgi:NlpC/P60 family putative phage cell wall peptidase